MTNERATNLIRVLLTGMLLGTSAAQAMSPVMLLAMGGGGMMHGMMHGASGHDAQQRPPDMDGQSGNTHQHAGNASQQNSTGQARTDNHAQNPSTLRTDRAQDGGVSAEGSNNGRR